MEVLDPARSSSSVTLSTTSAGQAADDDTEEAGDGSDDGLEYTGDAINDCHDTGADGLEERLNLLLTLATVTGGCGLECTHA